MRVSPTRISVTLDEAVNNLRLHLGSHKLIAVELAGARHAGAVFGEHLSRSGRYVASVNEFTLQGLGDGRAGEAGLADAIRHSGGNLAKVDLGQVEIDGRDVLSALQVRGNGVTQLSMPGCQASVADLVDTLESPHNVLKYLEVSIDGSPDLQSLRDALCHPNCKLEHARFGFSDPTVDFSPIVAAIHNPNGLLSVAFF